MSYAGQIGQTTFRREIPVGMPGTMEGWAPYKALPYTNNSTGRAAVYTVTAPTTPTASTDHKLTIAGITITVNSAALTAAQLAAKFESEIKMNGQLYRLFDTAVSGAVLTLTKRFLNDAEVITSGVPASNGLAIANTVAPGTELRVPFGVFVARKSNWEIDNDGVCDAAPPTADTDILLGVTLKQVYEKDRIGPDAVADYPFNVTMSVLKGLGENKGVWMRAADTDITTAHSVYAQVGTGFATRVSSGNIAIANATFASASRIGHDGKPLVLVHFDKI